MRTLAALLLALLVSTACSGEDAGPAPSADDIAAQIDCAGDSDDAADKVSCETDDAFFGITVYKSNEARDADLKAIEAGGVTVLVGDRFIIDSSSSAALEQVREIVGGELSE